MTDTSPTILTRVWITKYALTAGVEVVDLPLPLHPGKTGSIHIRPTESHDRRRHAYARCDYALSEAEARKQVIVKAKAELGHLSSQELKVAKILRIAQKEERIPLSDRT